MGHPFQNHIETFDLWLRSLLRIGEKLIRVKSLVAKKEEASPVIFARSTSGAIEIDAPLLRPSSAVALFVVTLNSWTLSGLMR